MKLSWYRPLLALIFHHLRAIRDATKSLVTTRRQVNLVAVRSRCALTFDCFLQAVSIIDGALSARRFAHEKDAEFCRVRVADCSV